MPKPHFFPVEIKEYHLDTFGHVNHAVYLQICEDTRWQICLENGITLEEIQRTQVGPIILEANIKYKKELKNREKVEIKTEFKKLRDKIFQITHTIYKANGDISAELVLNAAIWDMKERKLISPPENWQKVLG